MAITADAVVGSEEWITAEYERLLALGYTPGVFGLIPPCPAPPPGFEEAMRAQLLALKEVSSGNLK